MDLPSSLLATTRTRLPIPASGEIVTYFESLIRCERGRKSVMVALYYSLASSARARGMDDVDGRDLGMRLIPERPARATPAAGGI